MKLQEIVPLFKETLQNWREDKAPRLAAALSYYTLHGVGGSAQLLPEAKIEWRDVWTGAAMTALLSRSANT